MQPLRSLTPGSGLRQGAACIRYLHWRGNNESHAYLVAFVPHVAFRTLGAESIRRLPWFQGTLCDMLPCDPAPSNLGQATVPRTLADPLSFHVRLLTLTGLANHNDLPYLGSSNATEDRRLCKH